jgi:hypothetical protein
MRRDYVSVDVETDGGNPPCLRLTVEGPGGALPRGLRDREGELGGEDVDVAVRHGDDEAVLSIARRLTGEFLVEANVDATAIDGLVSAARERSGDPRYVLDVVGEDVDGFRLDERTLLVYDADGNLEREASLIPSGVEL